MSTGKRPSCPTCGDKGQVESIRDGLRPCSRCNTEAFSAWAKAMAEGKPWPPAPPVPGGDAA